MFVGLMQFFMLKILFKEFFCNVGKFYCYCFEYVDLFYFFYEIEVFFLGIEVQGFFFLVWVCLFLFFFC